MAPGVVEFLEMIDIRQKQGKATVAFDRVGQQPVDRRVEMLPVVECRQLVGQGLVTDRFKARLQVLDLPFRFQQLGFELAVRGDRGVGRLHQVGDEDFEVLRIFQLFQLFAGALEQGSVVGGGIGPHFQGVHQIFDLPGDLVADFIQLVAKLVGGQEPPVDGLHFLRADAAFLLQHVIDGPVQSVIVACTISVPELIGARIRWKHVPLYIGQCGFGINNRPLMVVFI